MSLAEFKKGFDPVALAFLAAKEREAAGEVQDRFLLEMVRHVRTLFVSGGKRIRPYVAQLAYQSSGGKNGSNVRKSFVGLELFHLFCLIHDDIIDRGATRHGVPTTHLFVGKELRRHKRTGDLAHIAEGQALLVGDLVYSWAYGIFSQLDKREFPRAEEAKRFFQHMVEEVILGQMIDVDLMTRKTVPTKLIRRKIELKTARYTFVRPMQIGATLAGAGKGTSAFFQDFGLALGTAFQIQDDLLDLTSDTKTLKKSVLSDIRDRQHTLFTQHVFENGTRGEQALLRRFFGKDISSRDAARVLGVFHSSGAIDAGKRAMEREFAKAAMSLDRAPFPAPDQAEWRALLDLVRTRTS